MVALCCKRVRYLRVQTVIPDSIRYGRSPAVPAPPLPEPSSEDSRPATTAAAAAARRHSRRPNPKNSSHYNGSAAAESDQTLRFRNESSVAADGSFVPDGYRSPDELFDPDGSSPRKGGYIPSGFVRDASIDPSDGLPSLPSGVPASANLAGVEGRDVCEDAGRWAPPLTWEELEPWEQRNPRSQWMMSSAEGGVGQRSLTGYVPVAERNRAAMVSDSNEVSERT